MLQTPSWRPKNRRQRSDEATVLRLCIQQLHWDMLFGIISHCVGRDTINNNYITNLILTAHNMWVNICMRKPTKGYQSQFFQILDLWIFLRQKSSFKVERNLFFVVRLNLCRNSIPQIQIRFANREIGFGKWCHVLWVEVDFEKHGLHLNGFESGLTSARILGNGTYERKNSRNNARFQISLFYPLWKP